MMNEINTLRILDHANCVKLTEAFETRDFVYLVLEFVSGCDLFERIAQAKSFTEFDAFEIIKGVCAAIEVRFTCRRYPWECFAPTHILSASPFPAHAQQADCAS